MLSRSSCQRALTAACLALAATPARAESESELVEPASEPDATVPKQAATAAPKPSSASDDVTLRDYHRALGDERLGAAGALSVVALREAVETAEAQLSRGRRDETIALLASLVESPRFEPLEKLAEGRAAVFVLGDALGRAGAYAAARGYLARLLAGGSVDTWYRRAVARLVDFALRSGEPERFLGDVKSLPNVENQAFSGDVFYLEGVVLERAGSASRALEVYARVPDKSRYWAQAKYRSGLIQAERNKLKESEELFCSVADPRRTPRLAPLFGGDDFFRVRDLSRLALGRVAHEGYRFDDARYYYHLVPADSSELPEALYESATSSYEAKDYASARELLTELGALGRAHPYEDEAWILDAYVDLARCEFPEADAKLKEFMARYEPVLAATRRLRAAPRGLSLLLGRESGSDAEASETLGIDAAVFRRLSTLVRVDPDYARVTREVAELDRQLGGLRASGLELRDVADRLSNPDVVKPRPAEPVANGNADRLRLLSEQTASLRRSLREARRLAPGEGSELDAIKRQLVELEGRADALRGALASPAELTDAAGLGELGGLLGRDGTQATRLEAELARLRTALTTRQGELAADALRRLELRLERLIRRARAGRIETVLGRKRAVELEIEALSQGYLPQGAIDSLDAARYLQNDEEYWPFDGEDWEDEYVGGEGLR